MESNISKEMETLNKEFETSQMPEIETSQNDKAKTRKNVKKRKKIT